jgi:hypothetical protein
MKGQKTGGRKKGTTNIVSAELRGMIEQALHDEGGVTYLRTQAQDNPTAFLALVGKCLPKDMNVKADVSIEVRQQLLDRALSLMLGKAQPQPERDQQATQQAVEPESTEY